MAGRGGALAGLVVHLEVMREAAGMSMSDMDREAGKCRSWYRKLTDSCTGPILDQINTAAGIFGYRLALVPIEEEE